MKIMRLVQRVLFVIALSLLAYCSFVLIDTRIFQARESSELDRMLTRTALPLPGRPPVPAKGLLGRLEITRLGISVIVMEGTSAKTLRRAAGHIPGTALPGEPGNTAISAHRDTFFRPLRNIRANDSIVVTTQAGEFRYRVVSTRIVDPSDLSVIEPDSREALTLITCYPFFFVGNAPRRFIVSAQRDVFVK